MKYNPNIERYTEILFEEAIGEFTPNCDVASNTIYRNK